MISINFGENKQRKYRHSLTKLLMMSIGKLINRTHRFCRQTSLCEPPKDGVNVWYPILKQHFFNKTVHFQKDENISYLTSIKLQNPIKRLKESFSK